MRYLIILSILFLTSCEPPRQTQVKIIDTYRDGFALRKAITILEMSDGTRRQVRGKWGKKGETIIVWINGNDISLKKK